MKTVAQGAATSVFAATAPEPAIAPARRLPLRLRHRHPQGRGPRRRPRRQGLGAERALRRRRLTFRGPAQGWRAASHFDLRGDDPIQATVRSMTAHSMLATALFGNGAALPLRSRVTIASLENALHLSIDNGSKLDFRTLGDFTARAGFFAIHSSCWQNRKNAPQQEVAERVGFESAWPEMRLFLTFMRFASGGRKRGLWNNQKVGFYKPSVFSNLQWRRGWDSNPRTPLISTV